MKIKWNKEREENIYGEYKNSLKKIQIRYNKFVKDLEKKLLNYITLRRFANKVEILT